jgi:hypothetical protein
MLDFGIFVYCVQMFVSNATGYPAGTFNSDQCNSQKAALWFRKFLLWIRIRLFNEFRIRLSKVLDPVSDPTLFFKKYDFKCPTMALFKEYLDLLY